jgi:ABC-type multidrug transport system ATPase subunit
VIGLRNLTKTYGTARAVDGLSLDVASGEVIGRMLDRTDLQDVAVRE